MADIFQEHTELEVKAQLLLQRKMSRKHCDQTSKATKNVFVKYHVLLCKHCIAVV